MNRGTIWNRRRHGVLTNRSTVKVGLTDDEERSQALQRCTRVSEQFPVVAAFILGRLRIVAVPCPSNTDAVNTGCRLRSRAQAAVEPATSVRHRWTLATGSTARLRATTRRISKVPATVSVSQLPHPQFI